VLAGETRVGVSDIDLDGEPEVIVQGAVLLVYRYDAGHGRYSRFTDISRAYDPPQLETEDRRFRAVEGPGERYPVRVLSAERGPRLVDVTREQTGGLSFLAEADRHALFRAPSRRPDDNRSVAVNLVAEEYLLGHGERGRQEFDRAARSGMLGSAKAAAALREQLVGALQQFGYA
jgi:hypothetical protein